MLWLIRCLVFIISIYNIFFGYTFVGILVLISFLVITAPYLFTQNRVRFFPIEIEFLLFVIVFINFILGEFGSFYYDVQFFDKFVHLTLPFLMAIISCIVVFSMQSVGKLKASDMTIVMSVFILTVGIGALWEIIEYGLEFLRKNYFPNFVVFQGTPHEDAYHDTMNDLVADMIGSILGAIWAFILLKRSHKNEMKELKEEVNEQLL